MALGVRGGLPPWALPPRAGRRLAPSCSHSSSSALPLLKAAPEEEELALFRQYREKRYSKPAGAETIRQGDRIDDAGLRVSVCPSIERVGGSRSSIKPFKPLVPANKPSGDQGKHGPCPAFMQSFPRRSFPQWSPCSVAFDDSRAAWVAEELQETIVHKKLQQPVVDKQLQAEEAQEALVRTDETNGKPSSNSKSRPSTVVEEEEEVFLTNDDVLIVEDEAAARDATAVLMGKYKNEVHACDTEVAGIDVKKESPTGHGRILCFSIYCGPNADFGGGKCRLWVDVLKGGQSVLDIFKPYFEDPNIKKVWHNYSFDAHILGNHGIKASGFYADTMHLARLWDSALGSYSLEALSSSSKITEGLPKGHFGDGKTSMKDLFAKTNIKKDGTEGKLKVVPPVEELQTMVETRGKWIHYSVYDAVCTWHLWESLRKKLEKASWYMDDRRKGSMYEFYEKYWKQFGELLVQMEDEGMLVDRTHLAEVEKIALSQKQLSVSRFQKWASSYCPDALYMNVCSDAQVRQLLFGGIANRKDPTTFYPHQRTFKIPNSENLIEPGSKSPKKYRSITLEGVGVNIPVDMYTPSGWPAVTSAVLKSLAGAVAVDYTEDSQEDEFPVESTVLTSAGVEGKEAGKDEDISVYGKAYAAFGGGEAGKRACMAIAALCELSSIDTLISNFIQPLQNGQILGEDGRVHCSLNINTETGRLSARRPNLQNQPALEKDRYKIRHAFVAGPGKSLIVADYGQLELRLLAHLTGCRSMMRAFEAGGDFHSRTALNMYANVREAVEQGKVLLEWDGDDKPPVPLLKDSFGSERRKAKMLNFSIAYGKTAMGLAKDWKVSVAEAQKTLDLWYNDRQEVKEWQQQTIDMARVTKRVQTLLGRSRHLPDITSSSPYVRSHLERAAINTPVQGSAADVAMCAMLEINRNSRLKELGWKLIMQVHDEVILEGPSDSCREAKELVVKCMSFPFDGVNFLDVKLDVDADFATSWYEAK